MQRGTWTRQPPFGARIDSRSQIAQGLTSLYGMNVGSGAPFDSLMQRSLTTTGAPVWTPMSPGLMARQYVSNGYDSTANNLCPGGASATWSVHLLFQAASSSAGQMGLISCGSAPDDSFPAWLVVYGRLDAGGITNVSVYTSGYHEGSIQFPVKTWHTFTLTYEAGAFLFYINGVQDQSWSNTIGTGSNLYLGSGFDKIGGQAAIGCFASWNRTLRAPEVASLARNSWQLFAQRSARASAAAASSFNPAWARGANRLIGSGLYV